MKGDSAKVFFSSGGKIFETNQKGENLRILLDNSNFDISSIDYNFETNVIYMADDRNNKVIIILELSFYLSLI